ncbi:MAG: rhodanese-like domain-containing protein [Phycisphaerales bacterium]|nr:rhodanese-like domain-containing protein [Phycisphaerales bacterium]
MTQTVTFMLIVLTAGACCGAVKLVDDQPTVKPPKSGTIAGTISSKTEILSLHAVSRVTKKKYQPESFSKTRGKLKKFKFANLPGDADYDICLRLADGREIEGIDLSFVDSRLLKLADERRKQLGMPPERQKKFAQADADALVGYVRAMRDFMEDRRVICIKGHGRRATMLVELLRLRSFVAASGAARPGKIIWRVELWYFHEQRGGWRRVPNQERLLRHMEDTPKIWSKTHIEYYPKLSVHIDASGKAGDLNFTVPEKSDPTRGRGAGTDPKMKTKPRILGLDDAAASQPAGTTKPAEPTKLIIDVRTAREFSDDHIAEAINIPYNLIADRIGDLGIKKDHEIVLYCRSGARAGVALTTLKALGYTKVTNAGGLADIKRKMSRKQ